MRQNRMFATRSRTYGFGGAVWQSPGTVQPPRPCGETVRRRMQWGGVVPSGSALSAISGVSFDRSLPDQEVAPEDEPAHAGTGERRGRVLTDLAGGKRGIKNLRHRLVAGRLPVPAATTRRSQDGERGAARP